MVVGIALLSEVGCSGGEPETPATTLTTVVRPEVGLSPPGTPLAAGFVVPAGTRLVGPVFPRATDASAAITSSVAVLQIDGDPFAAWDDLADQAWAAGVSIPHSGVCWWSKRTGPPSSNVVRVSEPRPQNADTLVCSATAAGVSHEGRRIIVSMQLWWWAAGAEIGLEIIDGVKPDPLPADSASDPGPAPAAAWEQVPPRSQHELPAVGEPFGGENNCFETGYDRLRVPDGARVVGGGTTPVLGDFVAVLAVTDASTVLDQLLRQIDPTGPDSGDGSFSISHEDLAPGGSVWRLSGLVGGGGTCEMWSSPDGHAVLITATSD